MRCDQQHRAVMLIRQLSHISLSHLRPAVTGLNYFYTDQNRSPALRPIRTGIFIISRVYVGNIFVIKHNAVLSILIFLKRLCEFTNYSLTEANKT